jgi:hypothetical protein
LLAAVRWREQPAGVVGNPTRPRLTRVPQELAAIVEARFTADGVSLTAH